MPSLAIVNNDLCVENGKFVTAATLESEIRLLLAVDRREPSGGMGAGGYWRDPNFGTLLWTRLGQPNTSETHRLIERDIRDGLSYMITTRRASEVTVTAQQGQRVGQVQVDIVIKRGDQQALALRFADLWTELGFSR